jgi:hypothetical protein
MGGLLFLFIYIFYHLIQAFSSWDILIIVLKTICTVTLLTVHLLLPVQYRNFVLPGFIESKRLSCQDREKELPRQR